MDISCLNHFSGFRKRDIGIDLDLAYLGFLNPHWTRFVIRCVGSLAVNAIERTSAWVLAVLFRTAAGTDRRPFASKLAMTKSLAFEASQWAW